jgi:hypothetical protein
MLNRGPITTQLAHEQLRLAADCKVALTFCSDWRAPAIADPGLWG